MRKELHTQLLKDINSLQTLLSQFSTESIVGMCAAKFLIHPKEDLGLKSPYKQINYLLGTMLTSTEPKKKLEFTESDWGQSVKLLEVIFGSYAWMFWPDTSKGESFGQVNKNVIDIAMPSFLQFHNSGIKASSTQVKERIEKYLVPLNQELKELLNISVLEIIEITNFIAEKIQSEFDLFDNSYKDSDKIRIDVLEQAEKENWNDDKIRQIVTSRDYYKTFESFFNSLQNLFHISLNDIQESFGVELSSIYWSIFTSKRGEIVRTFYPTERNIAEDKPIYETKQGIGLVPSVHGINLAILNSLENILKSSKFKNKFLSIRDNSLEKEVSKLVSDFFPEEALVKRSVYETSKQVNEHDLIVLNNNIIYVFESKASPPVEPFRDPEKAHIRISRSFSSNTGIQKAYDQGLNIYKMWKFEEYIRLYSKQGDLLFDVKSSDIDNVFILCVTRDDFGMIATNLSLLLKKEVSQPYPLAISVLDLYTLFDAWKYFNWGSDILCKYLNERITLNNYVVADDEMDYAGYYIRHGSFKHIEINNDTKIMLDHHYSNIFDDIFYARKGGKQIIYDPKPPVTTNLSEEIKKWMSEMQEPNPTTSIREVRKQGRNEKCQCGSGKKFKKCCSK